MPRRRALVLAAVAFAIALCVFLSDLLLHPAAPAPTGPVAPGLYALRDGNVNAWAVEHLPRDGEPAPPPHLRDLILVDAGLAAATVEAALRACGLDPSRITHVLLTHTDRDHTGFLPRTGSAEILLHEDEIAMTDGSLSRAFGIFFNPPLPRRARTLRDGESLPVGGRTVACLAAPGHTAGHCAWRVDDLLFTGDAFLLDASRGPRPFWRMFDRDGRAARASAERLLAYARTHGADRLLTGHSGWIGANPAGIK